MTSAHDHLLVSRLPGRAGQTLLDSIRASSHQLRAPCAGRGSCGKCRVIVHAVHAGEERVELTPLADAEREQLSDSEIAHGVRLACHARYAGDGVVDVEIGDDGIAIPAEELALACDDTVRAAALAGGRPLRAAIDIGTTTLAAALIDAAADVLLSVRSEANDQKSWGSDVVARIQAVRDDPAALGALQRAIVRQLDRLLHVQLIAAGRSADELGLVVIAGNTTMLHLLAGADPSGMAALPFAPVFLGARQMPAGELGFKLPEGCTLLLLPGVSAFVGADITAGVLATGLDRAAGIELLIDIGTNGEMVLGTGERLLATATAAGPAFEGAQIGHGCAGVKGALDHCGEGADGFWFTTIGDAPLRGICGSGLLDLTAWLRQSGALDETGYLELPDGSDAFHPDPELPVALDQRDVRQLQLAKGAIAAGIAILCQRAGIDPGQITRVHLAGGFGAYLRPASALAIGLLPPVLAGKVHAVGNTALKGALLAISRSTAIDHCARIAQAVEWIDLASDPEFQMTFAECMLFPDDAALATP